MPLTDDGANNTLDAMLGDDHGESWPATVYVGLSSTDPASTITEPSDAAYARVSTANTTTNFADASSRQKANAAAIAFPQASADQGTLSYYFISDASTAGNTLAYGPLAAGQTVLTGDTPTVPVGGLTVTVA